MISCDWRCICSVPVGWSRQGEQSVKPVIWSLSSPKQWIDHFSSNYFSKTKPLLCLDVSVYISVPFPYLSLQASSPASLTVSWELFWVWSELFQEVCLISSVSQACLTNIFLTFLDVFLDPARTIMSGCGSTAFTVCKCPGQNLFCYLGWVSPGLYWINNRNSIVLNLWKLDSAHNTISHFMYFKHAFCPILS